MWNTPKNTNHQRSFTLSLNCLNLVRSVQAFYLKFRGMDLNSAEQIFPKSTHFYKTAPFCSFKKDGMGMAQLPSTVFFLVEVIRQNWKKRPETRFIIQLATRRRHLKSWWLYGPLSRLACFVLLHCRWTKSDQPGPRMIIQHIDIENFQENVTTPNATWCGKNCTCLTTSTYWLDFCPSTVVL